MACSTALQTDAIATDLAAVAMGTHQALLTSARYEAIRAVAMGVPAP